jgi:hypothetical protein
MWNEVIDACKKQEAKRDYRFVQKQDKIPVLPNNWMSTFSTKQNETTFPSIQSTCTKWAPTSTASVGFSSVPIGTLSSEASNSPPQVHLANYTDTLLHSQTTIHSSSPTSSSSSSCTLSPSKRHQSLETVPSLSSVVSDKRKFLHKNVSLFILIHFLYKDNKELFQSKKNTPNSYASLDSNSVPSNADDSFKTSMPQCVVNVNEESTYKNDKVDVNSLATVASDYEEGIKETLVSNQDNYSRNPDRSYFRSVIYGQSICSITSY